jgi:hypothetical protein
MRRIGRTFRTFSAAFSTSLKPQEHDGDGEQCHRTTIPTQKWATRVEVVSSS